MGGALAIWQRDPQTGRARRSAQPTTLDELFDRVVVCPSGCWIWAGGTSRDPAEETCQVVYGRILRPGTRNAMAAHVYVYRQFKGPIPPGWQVDHLCRVWATYPKLAGLCVNPDHLEAVPHKVNRARRDLANGIVTLDRSEYSVGSRQDDLAGFEA